MESKTCSDPPKENIAILHSVRFLSDSDFVSGFVLEMCKQRVAGTRKTCCKYPKKLAD